ncbi:MAG: VanZ family protein [Lachnospiraceae bacterium]|nr:VanZ family protein [Lachnospiraceae bacterium]
MKKQTVLLVFTLLWMAVIFGFSAKPAEESADMSLSVGRWIGQAFVPAYDGWDEGKQETFAEKIDHPVRKCAHASEYAVLGMLLAPLFLTWGTDKNQNPAQGKRILAAAGTGILYAASDEFHQLFVPGRSGQITDVLIDSGGLLAGILLVVLIKSFYIKQSRRF